METYRYSPSGKYLGVLGADGRLKIWDTLTSTLKQEFVPSSHLTSTCTCIEWAPDADQSSSNSKKKRKRSIEGDVLVIGSATGSLLWYEVTKAKLVSHQKEAHSGRITGLSWSSSSLLLYSCGEDGFIAEWDAEAMKSTGRWRGSKTGITAIRVFGDKVLSAGHGITLWDPKTKTPSMTFVGHPSLITSIEIISGTDYFVTMCHTERNLRIWSIKEKNSVVTLTVPEPSLSFSVLSTGTGKVAVASVTVKGTVHLFKHKLNGPVKKPLLPSVTLKILNSFDERQQVPVLTSHICEEGDDDLSLLLSYGNWVRFRLEKLSVTKLDPQTTIIREFSTKSGKSKKGDAPLSLENNLADVPNDVKHLQSESDVPTSFSTRSKKRKNVEAEDSESISIAEDDGELPMEDRLTNLTIHAPATGIAGSQPTSSNLSNLLAQGLHSKDNRILQSVLSRYDEHVISNTVRSLPVQLIVPLLHQIRQMLGGKAQQNHSVLKWLKNVLQIHSAYLMACPSNEELLVHFMNLLKSRETLYPQMCQLKGKLELMKGNIQAKEHKSEQPNAALLAYQDESSEDEKEEEDTFIPSESEGYLESNDELGVDDDEEDGSDVGEADDSSDEGSESENEEESSEEMETVTKVKPKVKSTTPSKPVRKSKRNLANNKNATGDSNDDDLMDED